MRASPTSGSGTAAPGPFGLEPHARDVVAVLRWVDGGTTDGVVKRPLAAIK